MSSTFQAVVRGPSFTGFGKRPDFTPAHHVDRPTGIGPVGARIDVSRTNSAHRKVVPTLFLGTLRSMRLFQTRVFHLSPMRRRKDASGNVSLEIVTATARVIPLLAERGLNPARVAQPPKRAALFLRLCEFVRLDFPACNRV